MKQRFRWPLGLLVAIFAAVLQARAVAQTVDAGGINASGDAGVTPSASGDAGVSILTSGASTADAGSVAPRGAEPGGDSVFGAGPPAQAVQPRPDPTAAQVQSLRTLEDEVNGFLSRGGGFRDSVNGLLARHHERQLARLRQGFDRQIQAERNAEAEARRRAIDVFLRFLETYPEDAERTPDVMFRLAELYFDESAYAKLDADERADRMRAERQAQGLPIEDIQSAPVDYRCSVLLYRNVIQRFPRFRLADTTHYLIGWVLKEMGHEDEAISAYKGMVCPARFRYEGDHGFDLAAPLQPVDQPVICPRLFDILRPRAPQLISPPLAVTDADAGADGGADGSAPMAPVASSGEPPPDQTVPIPTDYNACEPLRGANGQPSRYAGEVWYYIGDFHFDNARGDDGNALAIAAYQASMRASERRRPVVAAQRAVASIQGAGGTGPQMPAAARAQFDPGIEYGQFWSKALYKVGWSYFRMQHGYPQALRTFSFLLDYYDYAGAEIATQGNRQDTIRWIGVIFTDDDILGWGGAASDDNTRCQQVVETVGRPPSEANRPFDCAGIMRIVSPGDAMQVATAREGTARIVPTPGRPSYLPQDRPWTPEAYLELANDYFQQTKYYEAITVYRIFLALYPLHYQAPRVAESIAIAYERQRQYDQAITARGRLANYTEGSAWWNSNNSHPEAQRYADQVARNSLHDTAITHHQAAGRLRQEAVQLAARARSMTGAEQATTLQQAGDRLRRAGEEYTAAVQAYTQFIQNYPNDESAYEFRYNRADALFWARNYQEASRAYADVRESNENDQYLVPAAYMAVKSQETHIRTLAQARQFDPCLAIRAGIPRAELNDENNNPLLTEEQATACSLPPGASAAAAPAQPAAGGAQPAAQPAAQPSGPAQLQRLEIPEQVQMLMAARISYANRVPANLDNCSSLRDVVQCDASHPQDDPPYRPKFAYLNARTLLRFGHIAEAEQLYRRILTAYCEDATVAAASFDDLRNLMVIQGREDDLEALAREQAGRTCAGVQTSGAGGITEILTDARFRHAMTTYRNAERASPSEAGPLYEQAAREMEEAVNSNRTHPQAALAVFYTALAYERTGRFDTATQTYIRITQEFNNTRNAAGQELTGENLRQRVNILEQSNFRAAVNLERTFDYDRAITFYNNVVNDQRFAQAENHDTHVRDALASIAVITTNLGRWPQAIAAWNAFLPRTQPGRERAEAEFRPAEIPYRAGNWADAIRSLQDYLRRVPNSSDTAQYRVQAQYNIALANRNLNNTAEYRRQLREVVNVFRASGQQPGSIAAAWAAEALFRDLDDQVTTFRSNQFTRGTAEQLRTQLLRYKEQLRLIDEAARQVVQLRGGEYSIGALTRQGQAHEHLATQEARIGELVVISPAQQAQITRAEAAIAQLERAADQLERANRAQQAQTIRDRAQQLRDQLEQQQQTARSDVQTAFDREAEAERQLAIINYGTAIHTARTNNIPTPFASEALRSLRTEDNQRLTDTAMRNQRAFEYRPGMFDGEAPGAVLPQASPVATPGLATE